MFGNPDNESLSIEAALGIYLRLVINHGQLGSKPVRNVLSVTQQMSSYSLVNQ
jgi:hypothetical protein